MIKESFYIFFLSLFSMDDILAFSLTLPSELSHSLSLTIDGLYKAWFFMGGCSPISSEQPYVLLPYLYSFFYSNSNLGN